MSHFAQMLTLNNLSKHDGRALWRYHFDTDFFYSLQNHLRATTRLTSIDARDCALYYAAWWKCCYNGGSPSKLEVYQSFSNAHAFDEEAFFAYAKKGATILGTRWIRNANTLYFRSLLLQGGLPVRHIGTNQGAYTKFLSRILEINPASVDDFAFDSSITTLLPASSRNDEVYACCFDIVKAIHADDEAYLSLLEKDSTVSQITATLRIKKKALVQKRNRARFRTIWVLEPAKEQIRLYLSIPDMDGPTFRLLLLNETVEEDDLLYEYLMFYEGEVVCKFIRNASGQYKTLWAGASELLWDGTEQFAELFLLAPDGSRHDCGHLVSYMPRLGIPTLWTKYSETQWILERGVHTSQDEGLILYPEHFYSEETNTSDSIHLCGRTMSCQLFKGVFCLQNHSEIFHFRTGCQKFEWHINDDRPSWMQKANLTVVCRKPALAIYNEHGDLIPNATMSWRKKGEQQWHSWNVPMAKGLIEISIEVNDITEKDYLYNIGHLGLEIRQSRLDMAEIGISNNDFIFKVSESAVVSLEYATNNGLRLIRNSATNLPKAIQANLTLRGQTRGLRFEIVSPFAGVEIIDKNESIVSGETKFSLARLFGYRLLSNQENLVANLYNARRPGIVLPEFITEHSLPLQHFADKVMQLFCLSDPLDGKAEVVLEICDSNNTSQRPIREYRICRYTQKIEYNLNESGGSIFKTGPNSPDLFAVPIDCPVQDIALVDLKQDGDSYSFQESPKWTKYIVFSSNGSLVRIKPAFIHLHAEDVQTSSTARIERIVGYCDGLLAAQPEDDIWQQLLAYYRICVNNDLSFAAFEVFRACSFSSKLAAKLYLFLISYDESGGFIDGGYRKVEEELGIFFHWVGASYWHQAMEWIGCMSDVRHFDLIRDGVYTLFANQHPARLFSQIRNYVMQELRPKVDSSIPLNQKIGDLRASLGPKVLSCIPSECPKIPDNYKHILPLSANTSNVKLLLKSPVAVALSIAGQSDSLWGKENEQIRRNVKYSQMLQPHWYAEAVVYSLSKI